MSIEADLRLSDAVVETVNRQIREMRRPSGGDQSEHGAGKFCPSARARPALPHRSRDASAVREFCGVTDEYLAALTSKGEPAGKRKPFVEQDGEKIRCGWKDKATRPTTIATSITRFSRCRTIRRTIRISWRSGASSRAGCSSTSSRASGCVRPIQSGSEPHRPDGGGARCIPQHPEGAEATAVRGGGEGAAHHHAKRGRYRDGRERPGRGRASAQGEWCRHFRRGFCRKARFGCWGFWR